MHGTFLSSLTEKHSPHAADRHNEHDHSDWTWISCDTRADRQRQTHVVKAQLKNRLLLDIFYYTAAQPRKTRRKAVIDATLI